MATQQIAREVTIEDKLRMTEALVECLFAKLVDAHGIVEIESFPLAIAMMYPKKMDIKCRPSDGMFLLSRDVG